MDQWKLVINGASDTEGNEVYLDDKKIAVSGAKLKIKERNVPSLILEIPIVGGDINSIDVEVVNERLTEDIQLVKATSQEEQKDG